MFRDLVDREEWFLAYKNMHFSYLHFCIFSKRANLWYWSKNGIFFSVLFLGNNNRFGGIFSIENNLS